MLSMVVMPMMTHAKTFKELVDTVTDGLAKTIVQFLFILATVYFFWGVVQYVLSPEQENRNKGRMYMVWGIIGLVVMFSVYSLIVILQSTLFN